MFTSENVIEQFISKALDELGFTEVSEETREQYLIQFTAELERRIGAAVLAALPAEQVTAFEELLTDDTQDQAAVAQWLEQYIPNYTELVTQTMQNFKTEMQQIKEGL